MNKKAKGSRNERRSRDLLKAQGFEVLKAGGSLGVFDLMGRQVQAETFGTIQGENRLECDMTGLPAGTYLLRLSFPEGQAALKVMKR